ncbi:MAG: FMN-binding glutamate synthase family protein [Acidimicrobiales bacterium]|nr:FMN-binding glutamate synthase family protein [Acidimicrobiales bacterium]
MPWWLWVLVIVGGALVLLALYDVTQKKHAILRNFPIVGHLRYLLERVGPELRQYIVTDNDEERPFSRDQRRWVYSSAKGENPYFGFGTDNRTEAVGYPTFRHSAFPIVAADRPLDASPDPLPGAKVIGARTGRAGAFRPASIVNISGMSFGSLSGPAIEALNRGAALAGCTHNTGEGGISDHHRKGGDLVFQIGTGLFGARDGDGRFSMDALLESIVDTPVRAIEIKLSQGAKPGLGGVLPAEKVSREISAARGVPVGVTVRSPSRHASFGDIAGLVDFVETIADATGLPVGIKSAVGDPGFWTDLADMMARDGRGPDFVAVDGGEGGTGAAPLVFSDHVALPFRDGFPVVFDAFAERGLHHDVVFVGAGKLGFVPDAAIALAMGVDLIAVGREAMLAVGCIQAQKCHTGHCPTGVATQQRRLVRGLDPTDKANRTAGYIRALRHDLLALSHAMGVEHPSLIRLDQIALRNAEGRMISGADALPVDPRWFDDERRERLAATLAA